MRIILFTTFLVRFALSEESSWTEDMGNVKLVTDETWSETVSPDAKDRRFLAFFFAPWCGHCKAAKPEYVAASLETDIKMIAVDCTKSGQETCDDQEVSGYPTLKYFDLDSETVVEDYKAARRKPAFLKFLQKRNPNYVPPPLESVSNPWGEEGSGRVVSDLQRVLIHRFHTHNPTGTSHRRSFRKL